MKLRLRPLLSFGLLALAGATLSGCVVVPAHPGVRYETRPHYTPYYGPYYTPYYGQRYRGHYDDDRRYDRRRDRRDHDGIEIQPLPRPPGLPRPPRLRDLPTPPGLPRLP